MIAKSRRLAGTVVATGLLVLASIPLPSRAHPALLPTTVDLEFRWLAQNAGALPDGSYAVFVRPDFGLDLALRIALLSADFLPGLPPMVPLDENGQIPFVAGGRAAFFYRSGSCSASALGSHLQAEQDAFHRACDAAVATMTGRPFIVGELPVLPMGGETFRHDPVPIGFYALDSPPAVPGAPPAAIMSR